jgi:spermidine synthase
MREYTNLTNIYPSTIEFGNYAIYQLLSPNYVDSKVLNFYNYSGSLEKEQTVILSNKSNECIMSNNLFERLTNQNFINTAKGDVIIFGLGLGLIIFPLLEDDEVTSITVIDKSVDIIDNLGPIIKNSDVDNKLTIINGDVFTYYQQLNDVKFDVMYFDYWNIVDSTIRTDMETLKELYKNNIKETGQIMYWCEDLFTNGIAN